MKRKNKKEYLKDIKKEEQIYKYLNDEKYLEFEENYKNIKKGV